MYVVVARRLSISFLAWTGADVLQPAHLADARVTICAADSKKHVAILVSGMMGPGDIVAEQDGLARKLTVERTFAPTEFESYKLILMGTVRRVLSQRLLTVTTV